MQMILDFDRHLIALNQAIKNHYEWSGQLLQISLLGGEPDQTILHPQAHKYCLFGHWAHEQLAIHQPGSEHIAHIHYAHTIMHDRARDMLYAIINKTVSAVLLDNYLHAQQLFIKSIDDYKEYLFVYRNHHDTLTGLPLRHLLYSDFELMRMRNLRAKKKIFILLLDIDRFKSINDTWGHNAGDDVLKSIAGIFRDGSRQHEHVYRFGGEEFVMLIETCSQTDAMQAATRMCQYLENRPVSVGTDKVVVTVTGGLTEVQANESLQDALGRADKAMYHGKNTGRNRCILATTASEMLMIKPKPFDGHPDSVQPGHTHVESSLQP